MKALRQQLTLMAATNGRVLIFGESGTGKELIARSLHLQSRRAHGPFVPVNVGAIPESLIESELFGYMRGAFTGAASDRRGLVEEADHGTLFLDEIGDMPLTTQVKLLRTLENSEVRRLGENVARVVDVRVIAATHHDLVADVEAGRFRSDLYYRLNVIQIELPPLRERREDIGLLASYFLDRLSRRWGREPLRLSPEAMALIERYDYPGNVRELENAIEHAAAISDGPVIGAAELPATLRSPRRLVASSEIPAPAESGPAPDTATARASAPPEDPRATWSLAQLEKEHIRRVLDRHHGNATAAARQLGISRTTLWRKLRAYGLERRSGRRGEGA
jgi:DNA-binding NtrC family response regulator